MPYEQQLNTLYLESLEHRRLVTDLTLVYQILHGHLLLFGLSTTLVLEVMPINY